MSRLTCSLQTRRDGWKRLKPSEETLLCVGSHLRERGGMEGGRDMSCNSSAGNKDRGNKSWKTHWKYSCTAQIAPFCNFYFLCLGALLVRWRRTARHFQPITVSSQPVGSVRENECVILKQLLGILHICTHESSQQHLFLREPQLA